MDHLIDFVFDSMVGFSGKADRMDLDRNFRLDQIQEAAAGHLGKFRMIISLEWVIRSTFMNWRAALEEYRRI